MPPCPQARRIAHRLRVAGLAIAAAAALDCRPARPERPSVASCGAEALLRVRNHTGRVLEVFESRLGRTEFIGFASPGITVMRVRGPDDLDVVYRIREPSEGRDAVAVTWRRPTAVARGPSRVALELMCR